MAVAASWAFGSRPDSAHQHVQQGRIRPEPAQPLHHPVKADEAALLPGLPASARSTRSAGAWFSRLRCDAPVPAGVSAAAARRGTASSSRASTAARPMPDLHRYVQPRPGVVGTIAQRGGQCRRGNTRRNRQPPRAPPAARACGSRNSRAGREPARPAPRTSAPRWAPGAAARTSRTGSHCRKGVSVSTSARAASEPLEDLAQPEGARPPGTAGPAATAPAAPVPPRASWANQRDR